MILMRLPSATPERQGSGLSEAEGIEQIKFAYDAGIQTFDTANVFANAQSEVVLGKAIRQHDLPRDEIVVMTKVHGPGNIVVDLQLKSSLAIFTCEKGFSTISEARRHSY